MIVVDTNVLIYAVGEDHPLRDPCRRVLAAQRAGRVELGTTLSVLEEFTQVRARRRSRDNAVSLARLFSESLTILDVSVDDFDHGLELFRAHTRLGSVDSVLAAAAMEHDAEALVSADRAFAEVAGLRHVDPATPALNRLLGTGG